ncbi:hypothetical protein WMY93_032287 [Mugilogobius chulae]|uniref:DUF4211 domain-containing protein n=1 Tax=Mugilogobius chulae TaxID=88201 RepID=A0AAW0MRF5_9GOBI
MDDIFCSSEHNTGCAGDSGTYMPEQECQGQMQEHSNLKTSGAKQSFDMFSHQSEERYAQFCQQNLQQSDNSYSDFLSVKTPAAPSSINTDQLGLIQSQSLNATLGSSSTGMTSPESQVQSKKHYAQEYEFEDEDKADVPADIRLNSRRFSDVLPDLVSSCRRGGGPPSAPGRPRIRPCLSPQYSVANPEELEGGEEAVVGGEAGAEEREMTDFRYVPPQFMQPQHRYDPGPSPLLPPPPSPLQLASQPSQTQPYMQQHHHIQQVQPYQQLQHQQPEDPVKLNFSSPTIPPSDSLMRTEPFPGPELALSDGLGSSAPFLGLSPGPSTTPDFSRNDPQQMQDHMLQPEPTEVAMNKENYDLLNCDGWAGVDKFPSLDDEKTFDLKPDVVGSFLDFLKTDNKQSSPEPAESRVELNLGSTPSPAPSQPASSEGEKVVPCSASPSGQLDQELNGNLEALPSFSSDEEDCVGKNGDLQQSITCAISTLYDNPRLLAAASALTTGQHESTLETNTDEQSLEPDSSLGNSPTQETQDHPGTSNVQTHDNRVERLLAEAVMEDELLSREEENREEEPETPDEDITDHNDPLQEDTAKPESPIEEQQMIPETTEGAGPDPPSSPLPHSPVPVDGSSSSDAPENHQEPAHGQHLYDQPASPPNAAVQPPSSPPPAPPDQTQDLPVPSPPSPSSSSTPPPTPPTPEEVQAPQRVTSLHLAKKQPSAAIAGESEEEGSESEGEGIFRERDEFVVRTEDIGSLKMALQTGREPPPIWRVQKALLQKFSPEIKDGQRQYGATSNYLGYFGDAKIQYQRLYVKFLENINKKDYVRVCSRKPWHRASLTLRRQPLHNHLSSGHPQYLPQPERHQPTDEERAVRERERRESERRESERRESERRESERRESERRESERRESERRESERRESERRESERRESEKRESERRESERRENERRENEKREIERRESERKESERRESERKETDRKESKNRESERREKQGERESVRGEGSRIHRAAAAEEEQDLCGAEVVFVRVRLFSGQRRGHARGLSSSERPEQPRPQRPVQELCGDVGEHCPGPRHDPSAGGHGRRAVPPIHEADRRSSQRSEAEVTAAGQHVRPHQEALHVFPKLSADPLDCGAVRVSLSGEGYNRKTLNRAKRRSCKQQELQLSVETCRIYSLYHALHHYKYHTFLRCKKETVSMEQASEDPGQEEVVQRCMANHGWIDKLFGSFMELLSLSAKA